MISILFKWEIKFENFAPFRLIGTFSYNYLSIIEDIMFIPIIFILTEIYNCPKAVDENFDHEYEFKEAFLDANCEIRCGSEDHFT